QASRHALATDEWLRRVVLIDNYSFLFKYNSGILTAKQFQEVMKDICERYPQVKLYLKNKQMHNIVASQRGTYLAKCFNRMEECEKNPEGPLRFKGEGQHRFKPFRYKHLGQFAPLGGEQTIAQLPGYWVSIGHSSQCQHKQAYICGPLHLCSSPMGV
ncbi:External alternative NAD(P)H-ubiquinone oxidoreductase B2, mitochondrial, partial [Glycine soja]